MRRAGLFPLGGGPHKPLPFTKPQFMPTHPRYESPDSGPAKSDGDNLGCVRLSSVLREIIAQVVSQMSQQARAVGVGQPAAAVARKPPRTSAKNRRAAKANRDAAAHSGRARSREPNDPAGKPLEFSRMRQAAAGSKEPNDPSGEPLGFFAQCHRLARWMLTLDATANADFCSLMPSACPMDTYARRCRQRRHFPLNAIGLPDGYLRSTLPPTPTFPP